MILGEDVLEGRALSYGSGLSLACTLWALCYPRPITDLDSSGLIGLFVLGGALFAD
jgi:hypothetical protein